LELLVFKESKDFRDYKAIQEPLEFKVPKVIKELQVHKEYKVSKGNAEKWVRRV
jgi:hypothetical protein